MAETATTPAPDALRQAEHIIGADAERSRAVTHLRRDATDVTSPARYHWEPEQVAAIKATVASQCSPAEFVMFLELAARYQLDPFARQIWAAKMGDDAPVSILVGRDGLLSIAERHQAFEAMDSDVVVKGDKLTRDHRTGEYVHEWGDDHLSGEVVGAWATVWRKDRPRPVCFYARFSEYSKGERSKFWGRYKSAMIVKCAESMALKRAFVISGLVVEEEAWNDAESKTLTDPITAEWGADAALAEFLRAAVDAANYVKKNAYRERKVLAILRGRSDDERRVFAQELVDFIREHGGTVPPLPEGALLDDDGRLRWTDDADVIEGVEADEVPAESAEDVPEAAPEDAPAP